jgi:threonine dehydrogenase-like Zn-dependent dehydrogenase
MKAVGLDFTERCLSLRDMPEPVPADTEVLLEVIEVGVCGTDRELAHFHLGYPPPGEDFLTLGHEALARVAAVGPAARGLQKGDYVAPMVRRVCPPGCALCLRGRRDLCVSNTWNDRGVTGLHGYFTEFAVDNPEDLVVIPPSLVDCAVLMEPLSVVEKAVDTAIKLHEPELKTALVLGAGPIGILSALVLQLRGLEVTIASLEDESAPRVKLIKRAGIAYRQGLDGLDTADIVVEASGAGRAAMAGFRLMAPLGVYALIGASAPTGELPVLDMIVKNQIVFGAVNASPEAFRTGLTDLARFEPTVVRGLIERAPFKNYRQSILEGPGEAVKLVHRIAD